MGDAVTLFFLLTTVFITIACCLSDWRSMRIPNVFCLAIALCFVGAYAINPGDFAPLWSHLAAGAGMLLVTYVMFALGMFGGGDAKLAAALALWLGLQAVFPFVVFMGVAGGGLAVLALYIKHKKPVAHPAPESWIGRLQGGRDALPYGIAISIGFWLAIFHTPALGDKLHEVISLIA